jgi:hypothetical protein
MFERMACSYSAYSIAHRNSDIFWKLDHGNRLGIAIKIAKGDFKYVSRFFNERMNARALAREVLANTSENLHRPLERMNTKLESHDGYLALLEHCRKVVREDRRNDSIDKSALDWALKEACWAATVGAAAKPTKLLSLRHPVQGSGANHNYWGSVRSGEVRAALAAARDIKPASDGTISGVDLLKLVGDHFDVFAGPIWTHKEASTSLDEYFGLACAIHVLEQFIGTDLYTERNADLLKRLLTKTDVRLTPNENDLRDPEKRGGIKSEMVEAVRDHYFGTGTTCNLSDDDRQRFGKIYQEATNADGKVEALKTGLSLMARNVLKKDPIVTMLKDIALVRHPAGKAEAMLNDLAPMPVRRESTSESIVD